MLLVASIVISRTSNSSNNSNSRVLRPLQARKVLLRNSPAHRLLKAVVVKAVVARTVADNAVETVRQARGMLPPAMLQLRKKTIRTLSSRAWSEVVAAV